MNRILPFPAPLFFFVALLLSSFSIGPATGAAAQHQVKLVVGTKSAPPFAMRNSAGEWEGISIELWRAIAKELDLQYEFQEHTLPELLAGLENQSIDVVAAALTVTAEREKRFDFSHPFHVSGIGIAVQPDAREGWLGALQRLLSPEFLEVVASLGLLIGIMGLLVWFFERKHNPEQFGGKPGAGIWEGFWWSAVTMTTVGYGDRAPKSVGGRIVALIWMFTAVIVISSFTAAITSSLTVANIKQRVKGPADLRQVRVGTLYPTTSSSYLDKERIGYARYETVQEGLAALSANELDAFVYDAPILRYLVSSEHPGRLQVLGETFQRQLYGFGLRAGSPLREPINQLLLQKTSGPSWQEITYRYLGR